MFIALLFLVFIAIFLLVTRLKVTQGLIFRERVIVSILLWSLMILIITEGLSLLNRLNSFFVSLSWGTIFFLLLFLIARNLPYKKLSIPKLAKVLQKDILIYLSMFAIMVILFVTLVLAIFVAPNNVDAINNHLPKVLHWIQNNSISYYPTHLSWQIYLAPFGSFIKLHFQLLSGTDYFANFAQWMFVLPTLLCVSLIAKHFESDRKTQILASFIAAAIPMGIMQASSSQDDYIASFFLVSFVYFLLAFAANKNYLFLIVSSVSLGLALLTKQNAYIFSLPFLVWFLRISLSNLKLKQTFVSFFIIGSIVLLINLPFFARNYTFSGSPLFSLRDEYINRSIGPVSLISGVIKNTALHVSLPIDLINSGMYSPISYIHEALGIPLNRNGLNWRNFKFGIPPYLANENTAPSTIHLVLIVISTIFVLRAKRNDNLRGYLLSLIAGFIIYSAVFQWQPSASRHHLFLFLLSSPIISLALIRWPSSIKYFVVMILSLSSFYFLFFNVNKPLFGAVPIFTLSRNEQYFMVKRDLYPLYEELGNIVEKGKYKKIGVVFEEASADFEYPLWLILKQKDKDIIIEHVGVKNPTKKLTKDFVPDIVIYIGGDKEILKTYIDAKIPVVGLK